MTDTWYGALHDEAAARQTVGSAGHDAVVAHDVGVSADAGLGARLSRASNRVQADTGTPAYWLKRIVVFPIGERWALIAVLAALTDGRTTLAVVVAAGLLAAAYTLLLRSVRSRSMRVPVLDTVDTARHRDDGLLARAVLGRVGLPAPLAGAAVAASAAGVLVAVLATGRLGRDDATLPLLVTALLVLVAGLSAGTRHTGALDWLVPAALRAAEYLTVVAVGLIGRVPPPVVFALLFALALHHYDLTARMEKGTAQHGGSRAWFGWDGRVVLLVVAALPGASSAGVTTAGTALMAGAVCGGFLIGAVRDWRAP
jgi:hypothetical protein